MRKIFSLTLMLVFIGISLILPGCEVDYYQEPEDEQGSGSSLFGDDVTVPSGFNWATMRAVSVNVQVDDQYNGNYYYTVELFDSNPLFDKEATLLSKGVAKLNSDFSTNVVLPTAVETIYVQQTDPTGKGKVSAININSGNLFIDFNGQFVNNSSNISLRSVSTLRASTSYSLPTDAIPICDSNGNLTDDFKKINDDQNQGIGSDNKTYYIPQGVTYKGNIRFNQDKNSYFYILGTWENGSNIQLYGNKIIILDGGKFIPENQTNITTSQDKGLAFGIEAGGIFDFTGNLTLENGVTIDNKGSFTVNGKLTLGSRVTLENSCHFKAKEIQLDNDSKIIVAEDALLECDTEISFGTSNNNATTIEMGSRAILKAGTIRFGISNKVEGAGALLVADKIILKNVGANNNQKLTLAGSIEIECSNYENSDPLNDQKNNINIEGTTIFFVRKGESSLVIPATECNDGGNNNVAPGTPANPVFPIIYEGSALTYLFEDNWPYLGDYDMNDLVLDVKPTYSTNAGNKVTRLQLDVTLRAVGATKRLAVGIQLDGIAPGAISNITRTNTAGINGGVFTQSNGLESGQTYAVIPVFDDAHAALGHTSPLITNTVKGSENNVTPRQVTFTIDFNNPLEPTDISVDKFNVFIINGGYTGKRHEIHLAGFQPTDKADKNRFGFADDNSNIRPYTSKNNMIWGLAIPGPAKYPVEWTSIRLAYAGLEGWATSGGTENKDWYNNPDTNKVYSE